MSDPIPTHLCADGVLRIPQAVEFSGCGRSVLYQAIARGEIAVVKIGRRTAIPRRSLAAWLERRIISTGPEPRA